jgi:tetratricopeptide (TPR) repeat protein
MSKVIRTAIVTAVLPLTCAAPLKAEQAETPELLYVQAQESLARYHFSDAISKLERALATTDKKEMKLLFKYSLAMAYKTTGYTHMHQWPDKAVPSFKKAVAIFPEPDAMGKLGFVYCKLKQYQLCMKAYTDAISLTPDKDKHHALFWRGVARHDIPGQEFQAYEDMKAAARLAKKVGDSEAARSHINAAVGLGMKP